MQLPTIRCLFLVALFGIANPCVGIEPDESDSKLTPSERDRKAILGTWAVVAVEHDGMEERRTEPPYFDIYRFSKDDVRIWADPQSTPRLIYPLWRIDAKSNPKRLDLVSFVPPDSGIEISTHVYELTGDTLIWTYSDGTKAKLDKSNNLIVHPTPGAIKPAAGEYRITFKRLGPKESQPPEERGEVAKPEAAPKPTHSQRDRKALLGTWAVVAMEQDGVEKRQDNPPYFHYWRFRDGEARMWPDGADSSVIYPVWRLEAKPKLKRLDLVRFTAPDGRIAIIAGVYELKGDLLVWTQAHPMTEKVDKESHSSVLDRPKSINPLGGAKKLTLKRMAKPMESLPPEERDPKMSTPK